MAYGDDHSFVANSRLHKIGATLREWMDIGHMPTNEQATDIRSGFEKIISHFNKCFSGHTEELGVDEDTRKYLAHPSIANAVYLMAEFEGVVQRGGEQMNKHRVSFRIREKILAKKTLFYLLSGQQVSKHDWGGSSRSLGSSLAISKTMHEYSVEYLGIDHAGTLAMSIQHGALLCQSGKLSEAEKLLSKSYDLLKSW